MRRISVLALLALLALCLSPATPAQAQGVQHYRHLEAQVIGDLAVGMPDERTVQVQHRDPATGQWDAPTTILHTRGRVTCGAIDGRTAGAGAALLVECDTPYYEDQAPAHSVALISRDGYAWAHHRLPGEAYRDPAISPSATYAAWLVGGSGQYVAWSATTGFGALQRTTYDYDSGGETVVADDTGTVTVIGPEPAGRRCVTGIHTRDLTGQQTHTQLDVDPGCTEGAFENVDAVTVTGGGYDRANRFTLARAGVGAPWALTRIAPIDAPGLVQYGYGRKRIATQFLDSTLDGLPLVAIGSPDRRRIISQVYDDANQTWGPQTLLVDTGRRCHDGSYLEPSSSGLYADEVRCGKRATVLVSADGRSWTVRDVGRRPWVLATTGAALPRRGGTTVVTPAGVREYPGTTDGRCDVVQPGREGELIRVHGRRGWPTKIQVSTGGAFHTVSTARRFRDRCRRVVPQSDFAGGVLLFQGRTDHYAKLVLRDGTWRLVYPRRLN